LAFLPAAVSSSSSPSGEELSLVSVANEFVVSHWQCPSLQRTKRVVVDSSSLVCGYAVAVSTNDDDGGEHRVLAVGGAGGTMNLLDHDGTNHTFRFTCW